MSDEEARTSLAMGPEAAAEAVRQAGVTLHPRIPAVLMVRPTREGSALDHARDRLIRLAR